MSDELTPAERAFRAFVRNRRAFAAWAKEARYLWVERKAIEADRSPPVVKNAKRAKSPSAKLPFGE